MDRLEALKKAREAAKGRSRKRPTRPLPARSAQILCDLTIEPHKRVVKAALAGSASLKQAIKAKCLDCCCWQQVEVAKCTAVCCPLWMYRPWKHKDQRLDAEGEVILEGAMVG